jgi:hypothetical protein
VLAVAAVFLGGAVGTKKIKDADTGSGKTKVAEKILAMQPFLDTVAGV